MRKRHVVLYALIALLFLAACREEEPLPTAVPTAVLPETTEPETGDDTEPPIVGEPETAPQSAARAVDPDEINWPPQILFSSPAPGEEVLLDGAITIRFDQPMNQSSVEAAFTVMPQAASRSVDGAFTWPRPDTMIFTPQDEFQRRQTYRVQIDQTAESANGFALEVPVELMLQTVGALEVNQVIPADGTSGVETDGAITVLFNRPVVPLVGTGQQSQLPQPLTFDPPIAGEGEWTSTSIYRFVPDEHLAGATTYRVTVDDSLTDVVGVEMAQPFSWRFTTLNPGVVSVMPDGTEPIAPTETISVTFNMPMDRASTEEAISLRGVDAPAVDLNTNWSENGRIVGLTPSQMLQMETEYQLQIAPSARAASGEASLDGTELVALETVPFPDIVRVQPSPGGQPERFQRGVTIEFAAPMDWSTVEDRVRIDPEPATVRTFVNQFSNELNLDFTLELNTDYTVTVPGSAADPYGNTLGEPYTWRFTTPGRQPIASFNLPPRLSQLSTSFATEVDILHVNVSRLDVALYDLGLPVNLLNRPFDLVNYNPAASPLRTWSLPLDTPEDEVRALSLPLAESGALPTGVYFLSMDTPETNAEDVGFWQNQKQILVVADTNIVVKEMFGSVHVWVTDLATGQPASGRNLTLYSEQGVEIGTAVSDSNGFARFDYTLANDFLEGATVVSNQPGAAGFGVGSSLWNEGISPWEYGLNATTGDEVETFAYIHTDRPIYRPGDTVYFKGIVRDTNYGRYTLPEPQTLDLRVAFAGFFGEEGLDETLEVEVSPDGSFSGEYQLPEDLTLGQYQFFVQDQVVEAFRQFTVAEYRAPEFLVNLTPERDELLRGQSVDVALQADYFFGGSAADLQVEWSVSEQPFSLDVPGPYFSFGDNGNFFYEESGLFGPFRGSNFLLNGSGRTDGNGRLVITLPADLLQDVEAGSRRVTVEANVMDLSNFPVASRTTVTFHAAETYVGVRPADYIVSAGQEAAVDLKTVDWDGQAEDSQDVEVVFYRREWEPTRTQDFGVYYTSWDAIDTEVARASATTNGQGQAQVSFTPEIGGTYLAVATVTDSGGRQHLSSTTLWVTDDQRIGWQIDPREKRMELVPDAQTYEPGDTAEILVQSPFAGPVQAWLTIERGTLIEQSVITLNGTSEVLEIPVPAEYAPNVFVTVTAIKGVQENNADNPYADIRIGITELVVSPEQLELNVELTPQDDQLEPGETAVYDIRVTDYAGNPVQADLSLALVDLAVLTLKPDNAPPILEAFYSRQPHRSQMGSGLIISGEGLPLEVPVEQFGLGGGGGDGAAETALARAVGEEDDDVRRDFPDTAFWRASITTDANGEATVEIPLPDTLTTWRLSGKTATENTLVGQASVDIQTSLPLLVRPVTPRFFTVGDVVEIGAIVNNNTGDEIEATVSLEAGGVAIAGSASQTVTVDGNDQELVRWPVTVANVDFVNLIFRVEGGGFSDATTPSFGEGPDNAIPVYAYNAEDVVATAGQLDAAGNRVEAILLPPGVDPDLGSVDVTLSPSLAAALLDTLEVHNDLDYLTYCAHAVTDQLLPNVAVASLLQQLDLPDVEDRLQPGLDNVITVNIDQLAGLVKEDGGWGWCNSAESSPWLTAYTLFGLAQARSAGFAVETALLEDAGNYLARQLVNAADLTQAHEVNRQAFFLYVLAQLGQDVTAQLDNLVSEHRSLLDPYAKAMLTLAYYQNDARGNNVQALLSDLNNSAVVSATGAHWEDESRDFRNLNSDIRGTAVVIQALSRVESDNPQAVPAVRWLMSARTASRWSSRHETAWSILALSEWMAATGELDADYDYGLELNLEPVTDGAFNQNSLTENEALSIPLNQLALEEANFFNFRRSAGDGRLYYTMHLDSFIDMNLVRPISRGITVERVYYDADCDPAETECEPIDQIEAGQQVRVELTIIAENDLVYAVVEDPIPAGAEAIDPGLETSVSDRGGEIENVDRDYRRGYWGWWVFNRIEYRDEKVVFLSEFLPAGTYQYTYFLQTNIPGEYQVMPTFAFQEFFPEVNGRADGKVFTIIE